jgi:hypothetical protein
MMAIRRQWHVATRFRALVGMIGLALVPAPVTAQAQSVPPMPRRR